MALTIGVGTVMEAREVLVVVTGQRKALALNKAIEEGVNHLVRHRAVESCPTSFINMVCFQITLSALQLHPWAMIIADEDATLGTPRISLLALPDLPIFK